MLELSLIFIFLICNEFCLIFVRGLSVIFLCVTLNIEAVSLALLDPRSEGPMKNFLPVCLFVCLFVRFYTKVTKKVAK